MIPPTCRPTKCKEDHQGGPYKPGSWWGEEPWPCWFLAAYNFELFSHFSRSQCKFVSTGTECSFCMTQLSSLWQDERWYAFVLGMPSMKGLPRWSLTSFMCSQPSHLLQLYSGSNCMPRDTGQHSLLSVFHIHNLYFYLFLLLSITITYKHTHWRLQHGLVVVGAWLNVVPEQGRSAKNWQQKVYQDKKGKVQFGREILPQSPWQQSPYHDHIFSPLSSSLPPFMHILNVLVFPANHL